MFVGSLVKLGDFCDFRSYKSIAFSHYLLATKDTALKRHEDSKVLRDQDSPIMKVQALVSNDTIKQHKIKKLPVE